ncbi:hypothetical protein GB927_009660 [Shinella sp. CPCC 100929]|uniref:Uncharacterized protein n=1 Tax=Shinella lacus TaxID=2654216 RepID=A0ABT1R541_9HYPH|nr:hypothetical protein [Shinella lacus]
MKGFPLVKPLIFLDATRVQSAFWFFSARRRLFRPGWWQTVSVVIATLPLSQSVGISS